MKRNVRVLAVRVISATVVVLTIVFAAGLTRSATAAETGETYRLETRIVEQTGGGATYNGSLELKITPEGVVNGYYRDASNPNFVMVSGGLTGNRIWLEFGTTARNPMRFSGSFADGKIDANSSGRIGRKGRFAGLSLIATPASTLPAHTEGEPAAPRRSAARAVPMF